MFKTMEKRDEHIRRQMDFPKNRVEFLQYVVRAERIKTNPQKVKLITKKPAPKNLRELRSFPGMTEELLETLQKLQNHLPIYYETSVEMFLKMHPEENVYP